MLCHFTEFVLIHPPLIQLSTILCLNVYLFFKYLIDVQINIIISRAFKVLGLIKRNAKIYFSATYSRNIFCIGLLHNRMLSDNRAPISDQRPIEVGECPKFFYSYITRGFKTKHFWHDYSFVCSSVNIPLFTAHGLDENLYFIPFLLRCTRSPL